MKGILFDLQRFCTKDGPGIRTTVFLKGCPLRCLWCHNPESQKGCIETIKKAVGDGEELCGKEYTVEETLEIVLKDRLYYEKSGGGITLSGGEPLFQSEFALRLMQKAKEHRLHITLETCALAEENVIKESAKWTDLYLFDFKESDPERHKAFTGVDNKKILENLEMLDALGKRIILRCPIIPEFNDRQEHFKNIAETAEKYSHIEKIQIEPYHFFGIEKYRRLNRDYTIGYVEPPKQEQVDFWLGEIQRYTVKTIQAL